MIRASTDRQEQRQTETGGRQVVQDPLGCDRQTRKPSTLNQIGQTRMRMRQTQAPDSLGSDRLADQTALGQP
eukprot:3700451-Rhodomonas_salina.2